MKDMRTIKGWEDLFIKAEHVAHQVFSCLDAEAVLACRVVCRDWGASVRTYKPLRTHIRETLVNDCVIEGKVNILEVKLSLGIVRNLDQRLFLAVNFGQVEAARLLIKFGANVNARNKNFLTVLHQAVNLGREEISKLLVKNGARVNDVCHSHVSVHANVQGPRSATALHFAAKLGQVNIVRFLIEQGATINSKDRGYMTPLHYAAKLGQVGVAMVLLASGADIHAMDMVGNTPLAMATDKKTIQLLHRHTMSPIGKNQSWRADYAQNHAKVVQVIRDRARKRKLECKLNALADACSQKRKEKKV